VAGEGDWSVEGITLMDHPSDPGHPNGFHVRSDGWMGSSLTLSNALVIQPGQPLLLCYGLHIHSGKPPLEKLQQRWEEYARTLPPAPFIRPSGSPSPSDF